MHALVSMGTLPHRAGLPQVQKQMSALGLWGAHLRVLTMRELVLTNFFSFYKRPQDPYKVAHAKPYP